MTSQVSREVVDVCLEQDECCECEGNNHAPNEPGVHGNTKHGGLREKETERERERETERDCTSVCVCE